MKFASEEKRQAHPQAKLIPENVWGYSGIFHDFEVTDLEIEVMKQGLTALAKANTASMMSPVKKARLWCAFVVSHPDSNDAEMIQFTQKLDIAPLIPSSHKLNRHDDADEIIQVAASTGHLWTLNQLATCLSIQALQKNITQTNYLLFPLTLAAAGGHLAFVNRLVALAGDKVQDMITANDFGALQIAARNGHLEMVNRLLELAGDKLQDMISAHSFMAFQFAVDNGHLAVVNRLLTFPTVFAYAESHDWEYGQRYIYPFVSSTLADLQHRQSEFKTTHLNEVFNLTDLEEAKLCFFLFRNLIRRRDLMLLDDLRFLIDIPAVKILLQTDVTPGEHNELLRLALSVNNRGAAEILLAVPAVRELAAQHDFYADESRGVLDLRALARDRESSIRALTQIEQQRLAQATARYQPLIEAAGVENFMHSLRDMLLERYEAHPANITLESGQACSLPAEWPAFQTLTLTTKEQDEALRAYYAHPDHTAWRYLSKPNPWLSPQAAYLTVHPGNATERWANFEEYQPLIAMLYLAAIDKDPEMAPTNEHTLESRLTHFISELALMGRAHNWDHTQERRDKDGHLIEEEYDDLQGDKPSCFSGVKRRLFQSVIGHPLLNNTLTRDRVLEELRSFLHEHFSSLINAENQENLKAAFKAYVATLDPADAAPLTALNISAEKQALFHNNLREKYGASYSDDPLFVEKVDLLFSFNEKDLPIHALKLSGFIHLDQLLEAPLTATTHVSDAAAVPPATPSSASPFWTPPTSPPAATSTSGENRPAPLL